MPKRSWPMLAAFASAAAGARAAAAPATTSSSATCFVPAAARGSRRCLSALCASSTDSSSSKSSQSPSSYANFATSQGNLRQLPFDADVERTLAASGYKRPAVNWYPGHIAKAERMLSETLKSVDVVIEVRDARAPKATAHPRVAEWSAGRPRVVVLTKVDTVPTLSVGSWKRSYEEFGAGRWDAEVDAQTRNQALQAVSERGKYDSRSVASNSQKKRTNSKEVVSKVEDVLFVDAKRGQGVHAIKRAVLRAGAHINERRSRRNLSERPLRVGIIGYPNVGKSALINKILGRKRAKTANTPGVTRSLQWIRVRTDDSKKARGKEFELLDSPGIIPSNLVDQSDALLLAACNSIGDAAYDNQAVASYLMEWIKTLHLMGKGELTSPQFRAKCKERYGFDPLEEVEGTDRLPTGEDALFLVADNTCRGDPENAARKILQDFRSGRLGPVSLQLAPVAEGDEGQVNVDVRRGVAAFTGLGEEALESAEERREREEEELRERAGRAVEAARERGLDLPPMVEGQAKEEDGDSGDEKEPEVGKGLFDGW